MERPLDYLIAGVQKGGTTALHSFLSHHHQISMPPRKELHFFDNEEVDWSRPDYAPLHRHFVGEDGRKRGEATPIYTYWPPAAERIYRYNPAIRLIVILRDPVERAYSQWAMETSRGDEELSFSQAIREGRRRVFAAPLSRGQRIFSYVERGFYAEQIDRLLSLFAREQVLFLRTKDLWDRHVETLIQVCDFLTVDRPATFPPRAYIVPEVHAAVPAIADTDRDYLSALFAADLSRAERITGLTLTG
jgi:hypothetical protein